LGGRRRKAQKTRGARRRTPRRCASLFEPRRETQHTGLGGPRRTATWRLTHGQAPRRALASPGRMCSGGRRATRGRARRRVTANRRPSHPQASRVAQALLAARLERFLAEAQAKAKSSASRFACRGPRQTSGESVHPAAAEPGPRLTGRSHVHVGFARRRRRRRRRVASTRPRVTAPGSARDRHLHEAKPHRLDSLESGFAPACGGRLAFVPPCAGALA
jgi:hypothetical protein